MPDRPSYALHARPILSFYCANCHTNSETGASVAGDGGVGSSKPCTDDRLDYSTYLGSVACFKGLIDTVFTKSTMPPGAARRIPPRDQAILRRWQGAGFPE